MKRRRQKRYSFTVFLAVSMILGTVGWVSGIIQKEEGRIALHVPMLIDHVQAEAEHPAAETDPEGTAAVTAAADPADEEEGVSSAEMETKADAEAKTETAEEPEPDEEAAEEEAQEPVFCEADLSWFDDALFIGDSRTVGLREYGNLGNAEVVADSGMNVYKIFEKEFVTVSGEKKQLETILAERQFGKVYLMLGINELGYDFDRTVSRYADLLAKIRGLQPEALIFLEANLHITGAKSEDSPIYTNENINRFNQAAEQMANGQSIFYLDVNELFDDENGNLAEEYTVDHAHVLGKYYTDWVDWILKHAVVFEGAGQDAADEVVTQLK